ncbi:MAG: DUF624 domain-containing protein [Lacisediminihabitans sp.]
MSAVRVVPHGVYSTIFGVVYLGLMTNALLLVGCLPLVVLLVATDPAHSWPLIAVAVALCAPTLAAAYTVFRGNAAGETSVIRLFLRGWREVWRRSLVLGGLVSLAVTVILVDVRFFSASPWAVVVIPVFAVLAVISVSVGVVGLVAVAEEPHARVLTVVRVSAYFLARRWYLTVVSLVVLVAQVVLFTSLPAIAIGITAAPALYLVWANSRYTLRPALHTQDVAVA